MSNYYTIVTDRGKNSLIKALANHQSINLSSMGVGDGASPLDASWETLPDEKHKFNISAVYPQENDPNTLICEGVITADVGGFTIRQIGVYDDAGVLFAIAQVPDTTKPLLAQGASKDMMIRFYLAVSDASSINIKVDNSVVLATRNHVASEIKKLDTKFLPLNGKAADSTLLDGRPANEYALKSEWNSFIPYNRIKIADIRVSGIKIVKGITDIFGDNSCILHYKFQENLNDSSNNKYHITNSPNVNYATDDGYGVVEVNNASLNISPKTIPMPDVMTISEWVFDDHPEYVGIGQLSGYVGYENRFWIRYSGRGIHYGRSQVHINSQSYNTAKDAVGWNHYVTIVNKPEKTAKSYKNGALVKELNLDNTTMAVINMYPNLVGYNEAVGHNFSFKLKDVRVFNRALNKDEVLQLYRGYKVDTSSPQNNLILDAEILYTVSKSGFKYKVQTSKLNIIHNQINGIEDGEYYIKAKPNNSIEFVRERPSLIASQGSSEYYNDGLWYSSTNSKLDAQVYLPYTATIKENKIIKLASASWLDNYDENMLGVGQIWQDVSSQRQYGVIYTNTTGRPIMVSGYAVSSANQEMYYEVDGARTMIASASSTIYSYFSFIVPNGSKYKIAGSNAWPLAARMWSELR